MCDAVTEMGRKGRHQNLPVDMLLSLRRRWHVPGWCWEGSGYISSELGRPFGAVGPWVLKMWMASEYSWNWNQGLKEPIWEPKRRGPVCKVWSPQHSEDWLLKEKEQGGRKPKARWPQRPRGHSPGWAPAEAREGPFRFGNEVTLTLDDLGGVVETKLGWASSRIGFKNSHEEYLGGRLGEIQKWALY